MGIHETIISNDLIFIKKAALEKLNKIRAIEG